MEIEKRLATLENELQQLKARIAELESAATQEAEVNDVLRASRFQLVDEYGVIRATLGHDEYGARLTLHDVDGNLRTGLHA